MPRLMRWVSGLILICTLTTDRPAPWLGPGTRFQLMSVSVQQYVDTPRSTNAVVGDVQPPSAHSRPRPAGQFGARRRGPPRGWHGARPPIAPRGRSILRIANGATAISGPTTSAPGGYRPLPGEAEPPRSTVKPPFRGRRWSHPPVRSWRRRLPGEVRLAAGLLAITASPSAFSTRSRERLDRVAHLGIALPSSSTPNSFAGMRPSVFRPTSMIAKSFSIAATMPADHGAFLEVAASEAFVEQGREVVAGGVLQRSSTRSGL